MKFTAPRIELAKAVAWTSRAVTTRGSNPAMSGLLTSVSTDGTANGLGLIGYNGHQMHAHGLDVSETIEGNCLIPAAILGHLLGAASGEDVTLVVDDPNSATFTSGRLKATIALLKPEHYPSLPKASHSDSAPRLPASELADMVRRASFAVQDSNANPTLTGLRLECDTVNDGGRFTVVGMQQSYASIVSTPMLGSAELGCVVPAVFLEQATSDVGDDEVMLSLADNLLTVASASRVSVLSTLVGDKPYPPWRKLQRASPDDPVVDLVAPDLAKRLRGLLPLADRWGRVRFTFLHDRIELAVRDGGNLTIDVIESINGPVGPDVRTILGLFLAQTLSALRAEKVRLYLPAEPHRAMVLRADDEHLEHDVLLMPNRKEIGDD
jgi:DNA polymerase III sliding clamp (beta) subunit (PCNA family)